jgi:hypothetical protein
MILKRGMKLRYICDMHCRILLRSSLNAFLVKHISFRTGATALKTRRDRYIQTTYKTRKDLRQ